MRQTAFKASLGFALLALVLASGCRLPGRVGPSSESTVTNPASNLKLVALALRGPDGQALKGAATVRVNGKLYPTTNGVVMVPEAVLTEAAAAGGLVVTSEGFAPIRIPVGPELLAKMPSLVGKASDQGGEALLSVALPQLRENALPMVLGPAGGLAPLPGGAVSVSIPAGLLGAAGTSVVASAYTPALAGELKAQQSGELLKLQDAVRALGGQAIQGSTVGGTACGVPFACGAVDQALGVNLLVDGALSEQGGTLNTRLDLVVLLRGWNGLGTPPWELDPAGWSESAKADALAAAKILAAFQAMDATGDPKWREAMKQSHGLELTGSVLSFPVGVKAGAASADGLTRVQVAGLAVLGVGLEVTLMSSVGQGLPRELVSGSSLVNTVGAGVSGAVGAVGGAVGSVVGTTGGGPGASLGGAGVVTNGLQLIANQGGNLLSNNGSTLVAGAQLLSNNASSLISNHGGAIMGSAYLPMVPPISQYRLLQVGIPESPRVRTTTGGVKEYLWLDNTVRVRATTAGGAALTDWVPTDAQGTYVLPMQGNSPAAFFIEVEGLGGTVHARAMAFAPGKTRSWVEVNSATTVLAQSTRFLQGFLPSEIGRVEGMVGFVEDKDSPYDGKNEARALAYLDGRSAELTSALEGMNLALYASDVARTQGAENLALAEKLMRTAPPVEAYDAVYQNAPTGSVNVNGGLSFTSIVMVNRYTNVPPP